MSLSVWFMTLKDVLEVYPVSKSTWWAGIRAGKYPKPYKLGTRRVAWKSTDIQELIRKASAGAFKEEG